MLSSVAIRAEIKEIEEGKFDQHNNVFKVRTCSSIDRHVVIYRLLYNGTHISFTCISHPY